MENRNFENFVCIHITRYDYYSAIHEHWTANVLVCFSLYFFGFIKYFVYFVHDTPFRLWLPLSKKKKKKKHRKGRKIFCHVSRSFRLLQNFRLKFWFCVFWKFYVNFNCIVSWYLSAFHSVSYANLIPEPSKPYAYCFHCAVMSWHFW